MHLKTHNNPNPPNSNPETLLKQTCNIQKSNASSQKETYISRNHSHHDDEENNNNRKRRYHKNNNNSNKNINNKGKQTYASNQNPSGNSTTRKKIEKKIKKTLSFLRGKRERKY